MTAVNRSASPSNLLELIGGPQAALQVRQRQKMEGLLPGKGRAAEATLLAERRSHEAIEGAGDGAGLRYAARVPPGEREWLAALRRSEEARAEAERGVTEVRAALELLIGILEGKGVLGEGHRRLIAKAMERAGRQAEPRVRLAVIADKRAIPSSEVDCRSRLQLCRARCCTFAVELSREDLDEGTLRWEIDQPYLLRREADGYCSHFARDAGSCAAYEARPARCRQYDCRTDRRIWVDFEARIPAEP